MRELTLDEIESTQGGLAIAIPPAVKAIAWFVGAIGTGVGAHYGARHGAEAGAEAAAAAAAAEAAAAEAARQAANGGR